MGSAMKFSQHFRVSPKIRLKDFDPADAAGRNKDEAEKVVAKNTERLFDYQSLLYAENKRSVLIVLQGMDTSGKDGVIRNVMRGLNPQGCEVHPFKAPSDEEREHDFLWRIHQAVPSRGEITIFNRSHYEDVLIARVRGLVPKPVWKARYDQINDFERMLNENGVTILKFFLHISQDEQKERLQKRLQDPLKNWKFNPNDLEERRYWDDYVSAYEDALNRCSTRQAPWFIIPSNRKWMRNLVISEILNETFQEMNPKLPPPPPGLKKVRVE